MFHMSSLKMGLDQAVLKGFESGASGEVSSFRLVIQYDRRYPSFFTHSVVIFT